MNIDGKADYAGSTMLAVRDTVRALHHLREPTCFEQEVFYDLFKGTPGTEQAVWTKLLEDGYLSPASAEALAEHVHPDGRKTPHFAVTLKGGGLALASAAKPIRRTTANKVLKEFLQRVVETEEDDRYLDVVDEVALFGSMLDPERDPVGDVDLAIRIVRHQERTAAAGEGIHGKLFRRDMGWIRLDPDDVPYKNERDLLKYLKSRKSSLSLHGLSEDGIVAGVPGLEHRVLYRRGEGLLATDLA